MLLCITKRAVSLLNLYWMENYLILVVLEGYAGEEPGFTGDLKAMSERVEYIAGITINAR